MSTRAQRSIGYLLAGAAIRMLTGHLPVKDFPVPTKELVKEATIAIFQAPPATRSHSSQETVGPDEGRRSGTPTGFLGEDE